MLENNTLKKLNQVLLRYRRLAIAFSGGVDSSLLLKAATLCLGPENIIAFTARAPLFPVDEENMARDMAASFGAQHVFIDFAPLELDDFTANQPERCYICKKSLFQKLIAEAKNRDFAYVADGANLDDETDYRPGSRATKELEVISPLKEAGMSKSDVRMLSQRLGLENWNKPAAACLASRVAYGCLINAERLGKIEAAENYLRGCGFRHIRVRLHEGELARIEVGRDERKLFFTEGLLDRVHQKLKSLGFSYVAFDLAGYRMGSHNEVIKQ